MTRPSPQSTPWTTLHRALVRMAMAVMMCAIPIVLQAAGGPRAALELVVDGQARTAVSLATDVDIEVIGLLARTRITQRFANDSDQWAEGRYQFPLPDGAAVDQLRIRIEDRVIEGEVREREQARRDYRAARERGQTAGLVEQHRANLFTTGIANIAPGEQVEVEIAFSQTVEYRHGRFSLRFPMTVLPRYENQGLDNERLANQNLAHQVDHQGANRQTAHAPEPAPPQPRYADTPVNPIALNVHLMPGLELATLDSVHHAVRVEHSRSGWTVELDERGAVADRDFELEWQALFTDRLQGGLFVEQFDDRAHALLMLVPPEAYGPIQRRRELILVIDTSGSMQGEAMAQAREALQLALDRLQPGDRFNIIGFSSREMPLFDAPRAASPDNLRIGRKFAASLIASGGTEIDRALARALARPPTDGFLRQIVFATDGAIANEQQVLDRIENELGDSRLFAIGIGHGVNDSFLGQVAALGRGTMTRIADPARLSRGVGELLTQLEHPALEQIEVDWPVADESWPLLIPDLYAGQPLMLLTRLDGGLDELDSGRVVLHGTHNGRRVEQEWPLDQSRIAQGVARAWARQRVDGLLRMSRHEPDPELFRADALQSALDYRILSPLTSLIAVDRTPRRSREAALRAVEMGHNVPAGRNAGGLRGMPATDAGTMQSLVGGGVALLLVVLLLLSPRLTRSACNREDRT